MATTAANIESTKAMLSSTDSPCHPVVHICSMGHGANGTKLLADTVSSDQFIIIHRPAAGAPYSSVIFMHNRKE